MGRTAEATGRVGLRERKRLLARKSILDTARAMFAERGYDNVTIAEIADAVNLSAKTVFVHFPSKEDLVFDGEEEFRTLLISRMRERGPDQTPLAVIVELLREFTEEPTATAVDELDQLYRMVEGNLTLQSRMRLMWERCEQSLAEELAGESGEPATNPQPRIVAAQLAMLLRLLCSQHLLGYLRSHDEAGQQAAFEHWLEVATTVIGTGIADYDPRSR